MTSRHYEEASAAASEIRASGGIAHPFAGDVSVEEDVVRMVADMRTLFGGIDVVCANAGIMPDDIMTDSPRADGTRPLTSTSRARSSPSSTPSRLGPSPFGVSSSSITGPITGFPGWAHYGATKAAQLGFMRSAAMELAASRITINAVMPGNIMTEGLAALGEEFLDGVREVIPLGEIGNVRDIGYAALYLASKEASFVTGTTLVVDGGQTVPETPRSATNGRRRGSFDVRRYTGNM